MNTTVGYLLKKTQEVNLFKGTDMLLQLNNTNCLPKGDKSHIIYSLDAMINNVQTYN